MTRPTFLRLRTLGLRYCAAPGTAAAEQRPVDVHLWYPADPRGFTILPRTACTSWLYGRTLVPELWDR